VRETRGLTASPNQSGDEVIQHMWLMSGVIYAGSPIRVNSFRRFSRYVRDLSS